MGRPRFGNQGHAMTLRPGRRSRPPRATPRSRPGRSPSDSSPGVCRLSPADQKPRGGGSRPGSLPRTSGISSAWRPTLDGVAGSRCDAATERFFERHVPGRRAVPSVGNSTQVPPCTLSITTGMTIVPAMPVAGSVRPSVTRGKGNIVTTRVDDRRCRGRCGASIALVAGLLILGFPDGRSPRAAGVGDRADAALAQRTSTVRDPHVAPAGGGRCGGHCADGRCGHGGGRRHHPDCRHGHCVPHCLVRTESFGYYGTRWRRWPGSGVVPASALEGATPVPTPRSTVPRADEESPDTGAETEESGRGDPQPDPQRDPSSDAAGPVRLPSAPEVDGLPGVDAPSAPAGTKESRRPTGWRGLLVDGAVTPTLFARPAPRQAPDADDRRAATPGRQPADASAERGR